MPQLISVGNKLFRINPVSNKLEISSSDGILWITRGSINGRYGKLKDILWFHNQLFALTEKNLLRSRNEGCDWGSCGSGKTIEGLIAIQDGGRYLYALSSDGHFLQSYNEGADWMRKG